jgi:hypothetical protein
VSLLDNCISGETTASSLSQCGTVDLKTNMLKVIS